jgi:alpha-amylase
MKRISLIIEIHQPMRLRTYRFFDISDNHYYYDDYENESILKKTIEKSYIQLNKLLLNLIDNLNGDFKFSFLFSGVVLDQFELYAPEMIGRYKSLIDTGCVELVSGTYSNTFNPLFNNLTYINQLTQQRNRLKLIFDKEPVVAPEINFKYAGIANQDKTIRTVEIKKKDNSILIGISSKVSFDWTFTSGKFEGLLYNELKNCDTLNIFIPYTMTGDYQNHDTNLPEFLKFLVDEMKSQKDYSFVNPTDTLSDSMMNVWKQNRHKTKFLFRLNKSSFSDMQINAFEKLYSMSEKIEKCQDPFIKKDWLYLQSCDHFYYMNQDLYNENKSRIMFIPYDSAYFAYINYMNILNDFSERTDNWLKENDLNQKDLNINNITANLNMQQPPSFTGSSKNVTTGRNPV